MDCTKAARAVWVGVLMLGAPVLAGCEVEAAAVCPPSGPTCADLAGPDASEITARRPLIDQTLWRIQTPDEDPLAAHRPQQVRCGRGGFYLERGNLEIDTQACNYLSLTQDSLIDVHPGQAIELGLYHFDLTAPDPAQAHVALLFDGHVQWEQMIDIPGPAYVFDLCFTANRSLTAGGPITLHLHNHGQNTWVLTHLRSP